MKVLELKGLSQTQIKELCKRHAVDFIATLPVVQEVIQNVKIRGDKAVLDYTLRFDGVSIDTTLVEVPSPENILLPTHVAAAFDQAYDNIYNFHLAQLPNTIHVETMPGVICSREARPIRSVGLYVPGGTAVLPSSVLMLGIPAQIAGCEQVVIATPPRKDGSIAPEVLYCASKCGIKHILRAGGAQAVAALAYGTKTIPKVDKILGPGNQYVTCAKMMLQLSDALVSIDMPAGPSELLVIADETSRAEFVAADLLSQAEHGADSQVVLVSTSKTLIDKTQKQLELQLARLPRADFAKKALDNSIILFADTMEEALAFSNLWAPEHLIISTDDAEHLRDKITCAGSVFLGHWTPESAGDYASGTNHTLPTSGYARMYSGVSLDSYYTMVTFQQITPEGLQKLGPVVEIMAESESLEAHKKAVSIRLKTINAMSESN